MAFAGAIEEAAEILEGIDDVPFGEGEEGVVQFAPVARLVDRGQGHRRRAGRCGAGRGPAHPLDIGQRQEHRQRDQDRDTARTRRNALSMNGGPRPRRQPIADQDRHAAEAEMRRIGEKPRRERQLRTPSIRIPKSR